MAFAQNRFTLGGLNPNDVATLIVVLILSLPVALKWTKYLLWFVWPAEALLVALLIGTGSRGGVLALICGLPLGIALLWRSESWFTNWRIWLGVGLVLVVGAGAGLSIFPKSFRLGTLDVSPEASAGRRLEVWSTVPAMLAAAPNGWGIGKSAEAYEEWFEPVGETVELKHLLSSHLTWLVEFGWPLRWLYILLWMAAFALLFPSSRFSFPPWGVAVWTAFAVALIYNAAGKWWNWPLPSLWLLAAFILRCRQKTFPTGRSWLFSVGVSGFLVGMPFLIFYLHPPQTQIRTWDNGNIVVIGTGKPAMAVLGPSKDVLGNFYGHEIRKESPKTSGSIMVVAQPDAVAAGLLADCHLYMISGGDETALDNWHSIITPKLQSKLVLINCRVPLNDWIKGFGGVKYCHGEFYGDAHYKEWKDYSANNPTVSVEDISRQEAYIADWWPLLDETTAK